MKDSNLEEPLIHPSTWIRNDAVINEEDDEAGGSRRSLPTKQIKISIELSFHDIILLCICLYSVDVFCMIECFIKRILRSKMGLLRKIINNS